MWHWPMWIGTVCAQLAPGSWCEQDPDTTGRKVRHPMPATDRVAQEGLVKSHRGGEKGAACPCHHYDKQKVHNSRDQEKRASLIFKAVRSCVFILGSGSSSS